jgi:branched-chain amino acid transport system permease protein
MIAALAEQVLNGLMIGSIYVLVALGMVLIYGVMHVLNFAHGVLFMVGGYLCHFFFTRLTGSYAVAVVLSMAALALIGVAIERSVFRPLQGNLRNQVIASLGLILVIENLVIALWGPNALQMKTPATEHLVSFGELRFPLQHLLIIVITAIVVAAMFAFLKWSKFGTALRATSQDRNAAMVVGIPVERVDMASFALGTALAALGGALVGPLFLVFPLMGDAPMVKGLAGILLGGMGSVPGAVVGGMIIGVAESVSTLFLPTDYRDSIAFAIMVLILLVRPRGLFGQRVRGEA